MELSEALRNESKNSVGNAKEFFLALAQQAQNLEVDAKRGRAIAETFLPVMESMRPLVLNLERLKDMVK